MQHWTRENKKREFFPELEETGKTIRWESQGLLPNGKIGLDRNYTFWGNDLEKMHATLKNIINTVSANHN